MLLMLLGNFDFPNSIADNWTNLIVAFLTAIMVLVNALFVYMVWRQISQTNDIIKETKTQNELMIKQLDIAKDEIDNKLRPRVSVENIVLAEKHWVMDSFIFNAQIKNYGESPASHMKIYIKEIESDKKDSIDIKKKIEHDPKSLKANDITLMPNQTLIQNVYVDIGIIQELDREEPSDYLFYLLVSIEYHNGRTGKEEYFSNILYEYSYNYVFQAIESYAD